MKLLLPAVLIVVLCGCATTHLENIDDSDDAIESNTEDTRWCENVVSLTSVTPMRQITWMVTDSQEQTPQYRIRDDADEWAPWTDVEITFSEGSAYNGRILLDTPVNRIELRGDLSLHDAHFSTRDKISARRPALTPPAPTTADTNLSESNAAADGPVLTRREWNAIDPERVCRDVSNPYRITFHHTFIPGEDGADAASRVRQIQSYHINERGWCDIGYHFLIGQDGRVFRGRADVDRPGAHVGGHNDGNVGIGFIGDFMTNPPTSLQVDAAARVTRWLHDSFEIPLNRSAVRGHTEWPGQSTGCPGDMMHLNEIDMIGEVVNRARQLPGLTPATDNLFVKDLPPDHLFEKSMSTLWCS